MSGAYYNEFDKGAAAWLRELISMGAIAAGDVDERSIEDVHPSDLRGYTQCHFFAGIGGWSHALRLAGWPDDRPVWTGSCPCQPFSSAGKGAAFADERHLWPAFLHLIKERKPSVVLGEQVASKDADAWIDLVQNDLEGLGYAVGAVPFPSASVGAPHIRDRLYWLADSASNRRVGSGPGPTIQTGRSTRPEQFGFMAGGFEGCTIPNVGETPGMATRAVGNSNGPRLEGFGSGHKTEGRGVGEVRPIAETSELGGTEHAPGNGREQWGIKSGQGSIAAGRTLSGLADDQLQQRPHGEPGVGVKHDTGKRVEGTATITGLCGDSDPGPVNGRWSDADWLFCRDGKWRPVEPGTFPLVDGLPKGVVPSSRIGMAIDANKTAEARVMRLRGYGNAINPIQAALFIEAFMESIA